MRHSPKLTSLPRPSQLTRTRSTRGTPLHVHCCTRPPHSVCRGIPLLAGAHASTLAAAMTVPLAVIVARCSHARGVQRNQYKTIRKVPSRSRSNAKKMPSSSMKRSAGCHLYVQSFDANFAPSEKVDGGRVPLLKYGANDSGKGAHCSGNERFVKLLSAIGSRRP